MLCIESLEPRKLSSGSVQVVDGVLTITGTDDADRLIIKPTNPRPEQALREGGVYYDITLNGETTTQLYNSVRSIRIDLGGGDDVADVEIRSYSPEVTNPSDIYLTFFRQRCLG